MGIPKEGEVERRREVYEWGGWVGVWRDTSHGEIDVKVNMEDSELIGSDCAQLLMMQKVDALIPGSSYKSRSLSSVEQGF